MNQEHFYVLGSHTPYFCVFPPQADETLKTVGKPQAAISEGQVQPLRPDSSLNRQNGVHFTVPLCLAHGLLPITVCDYRLGYDQTLMMSRGWQSDSSPGQFHPYVVQSQGELLFTCL